MTAIVNLNGQLMGSIDPSDSSAMSSELTVFDRSFLYGDSIYEVIRTVDGVPFTAEEHFERLMKSAKLCKMDLSRIIQNLRKDTFETIEKYQAENPNQDVYCRIVVSRGSGPIGFPQENVVIEPFYALIAKELPTYPDSMWNQGAKIQIVDRVRNDRRAIDPAMKSGNYLNNVLALLEARENDFEDAVLCNNEGFVTEGTTFNFYYVRNGRVATAPMEAGILGGITRDLLLEFLRDEGIECREVLFPKERVYDADEVFITSTTRDVFPVTQVDHVKFNRGRPGPITTKINELFKRKVRESLRSGTTSFDSREVQAHGSI